MTTSAGHRGSQPESAGAEGAGRSWSHWLELGGARGIQCYSRPSRSTNGELYCKQTILEDMVGNVATDFAFSRSTW